MNCSKCGATNQVGNFCSSCGNQINNNQIGSITIQRKKQFGGILPFDVKVDNIFLGQINNGETKTFPLYYGEHVLNIYCAYDCGTIGVLINDNQKHINYLAYSKSGVDPNKRVKIDVISYSK